MTIQKISSRGREYKIYNGIYYDAETSDELIYLLDKLKEKKERIIVRYGNNKTGRDWGEEHDIMGTIGNSTGEMKIPLLVHSKRSMGGGGLMSGAIIKIIKSKGKSTLYQHPKYHMDDILKNEIKNLDYLNKKFKRLGII